MVLLYISLHSFSHYAEIFRTNFLTHVLRNIKVLKRRNRDITLSIGLSKINEESFEEVLRFAVEEGIRNIEMFPVRFEFSNSYRLIKDLHLLEQKLNWDRIIEVVKSYRHELNIHPTIGVLRNFQKFYAKKRTWNYPCSFPFHRLIVDYEGNLRLCCGDLPPIGDAINENIKDILFKESTSRYMRMALYRKGACKKCVYAPDPDLAEHIKSKIANRIRGESSEECEV
ncbi:radical SAM protein [Methanophagales archaeon]|nr:MAG: radical SAM protein [Methanophagales archaeon]